MRRSATLRSRYIAVQVTPQYKTVKTTTNDKYFKVKSPNYLYNDRYYFIKTHL
jgi:hypothetical protein